MKSPIEDVFFIHASTIAGLENVAESLAALACSYLRHHNHRLKKLNSLCGEIFLLLRNVRVEVAAVDAVIVGSVVILLRNVRACDRNIFALDG